ncbi:MAG: proline--tRNA ligase [Candidatus Nealsonbacteria bacterium]|nr:MAG: proline--tRNA ligase [Candidatus Nealsonbacteria bacterium]
MLQSQLFTKTKKKIARTAIAISHKYLIKGDFIEQSISGVYRFLPLGFLVLKKIEKIIREEMLELGAQEVYLSTFQNKNLWQETKRWNAMDPPLFKLKDRHNKELALGSTHEEEMVDMVRKRVSSYQDLPFFLFQIQNKFRNEMRATGGLLRTIEFIMKDLYSFHSNKKDLVNFYEKIKKSYFKIFKRCGLKTVCVEASSGTIGGKLSHEFMVISNIGEDKILLCKKCNYGVNIEVMGRNKKCPQCKSPLETKKSIEVGHIFYLGTKYSKDMNAKYKDKDGKEKFILMGCYGIGLPRLMATSVEVNSDKNGIIWPKEIAPFQIHLISLDNTKNVRKKADEIYRDLSVSASQKRSCGRSAVASGIGGQKQNIEILYDDRKDKSAGEKFADCDLIGIPMRIVVSEKTLRKNSVELKRRDESRVKLIEITNLKKNVEKNL